MHWEFSPQQVVKGEVGYGLGQFRADLETEVAINSPGATPAERAATFDLVYDLCHWRARGQDLESFLVDFAHDPPTCQFLRGIAPVMAPNVEMLGAILQRMIMDGVESGLELPVALRRADERHRRIVVGPASPASR
jgi:hypothetical protein